MQFTYSKTLAHYGTGFVIVPEQIADNQKTHDAERTVFRAYHCDCTGSRVGGSVRVRLNGKAYGLWTTGTGDMRVTRA